MAAGWPTTVPQEAMAGIAIQRETNRVAFPVEVGPAKRRRRSSIATELLTFRTRMTVAQYGDLDEFHMIDLKDGTRTFMRKDPRDILGADVEFEFVDVPQFVHLTDNLCDVSLSLRRLP